MKAALLRPDQVPPPDELKLYQVERRFHQEFGCPSPPVQQWPGRKVADYILIQQVLDEIEAEQNKPTGAGPGGAPSRPAATADTTEAAYQRLRAQAATPPMPSPS